MESAIGCHLAGTGCAPAALGFGLDADALPRRGAHSGLIARSPIEPERFIVAEADRLNHHRTGRGQPSGRDARVLASSSSFGGFAPWLPQIWIGGPQTGSLLGTAAMSLQARE